MIKPEAIRMAKAQAGTVSAYSDAHRHGHTKKSMFPCTACGIYRERVSKHTGWQCKAAGMESDLVGTHHDLCGQHWGCLWGHLVCTDLAGGAALSFPLAWMFSGEVHQIPLAHPALVSFPWFQPSSELCNPPSLPGHSQLCMDMCKILILNPAAGEEGSCQPWLQTFRQQYW